VVLVACARTVRDARRTRLRGLERVARAADEVREIRQFCATTRPLVLASLSGAENLRTRQEADGAPVRRHDQLVGISKAPMITAFDAAAACRFPITA
jgi:hypothetical protein